MCGLKKSVFLVAMSSDQVEYSMSDFKGACYLHVLAFLV